MGYTLIRADELFNEEISSPKIYLGGNCRGRDWRLEFFQRFEDKDVVFINPRRDTFADPDLDPVSHAKQVAWDKTAIDHAKWVVFWLGEGLSNQAARVEIGYAIGKGKTVLIGAEDGFLGLEHLTAFSGMVLSSSLDGLINRFASVMQAEE